MTTNFLGKIPHSVSQPPRVVDIVHNICKTKHFSPKTEEAYMGWILRFSNFHKRKPLSQMARVEVEEFLTYLAVVRNVSAATQNQAFASLVTFLYKHVIPKDLGKIDAIRAKKSKHIPEVFNRSEVKAVLFSLKGTAKLMGQFLYGCGLRLNECLALRVKDIDFERHIVNVRGGKGKKDRVVPLPCSIVEPLKIYLIRLQELYKQDQANKIGVSLPDALDRKYPDAPFKWGWYFLFPSRKVCINPKWVGDTPKRHSVHETVLQKAMKAAIKEAGIVKHGGCHTLRHSYCTHLLEDGYNVRKVQVLMGHEKLETTMGYIHVMDVVSTVKSPMDNL